MKKIKTAVQLDDGTVYVSYDYPTCHQPAPKPLPASQGMTDEQVRDTWDAHLRHVGHEDA